jgi:hypothetical protein
MLRALSSRAAASLCSQAVYVFAGGSSWAQSLPAAATAVLVRNAAVTVFLDALCSSIAGALYIPAIQDESMATPSNCNWHRP